MLHSPRKLPDGPEIFPFGYFFGKNPQTRATLPHQIPEIDAGEQRKSSCSKAQKVELDFDTVGKGGGNTPGTDLPVVAGPSLAHDKVIIDQLPRLPRLGLGEVTSN